MHTALNLFGFSVSLMFIVLFGLYLKNEYSADKYHINKDRVFRLHYSDDYGFPVLAGEDLKANFPEIESAVVMMPMEYLIYQDIEKRNVTNEKALAVDSCFLICLPIVL